MLCYAVMFIVAGSMAVAMNLAGVAPITTHSSWTLLASGIVLLLIHLVVGRIIRVS